MGGRVDSLTLIYTQNWLCIKFIKITYHKQSYGDKQMSDKNNIYDIFLNICISCFDFGIQFMMNLTVLYKQYKLNDNINKINNFVNCHSSTVVLNNIKFA